MNNANNTIIFNINFSEPTERTRKIIEKPALKQEKKLSLISKKIFDNSQKISTESIKPTLQPAQTGVTFEFRPQNKSQSKIINFQIPQNSSVIKNVHLRPSTISQVISLEEEMKKLGVTVTFEDDLNTAKAFVKLSKKAKNIGLVLPERIAFFTPIMPMISGHTPINPKLPVYFAKDLFKNAQKGHVSFRLGEGICTVRIRPLEEIFYHEIAHFNHLKNCPDDKTSAQIFQDFLLKYGKEKVIKEVSEGAIKETTGKEFVADVMVGLIQGKNFSNPVIETYRLLKGPIF